MKVYLVRHGDPVKREENPECPLSDDGRRGVSEVARRLEEKGVRLNAVMHSGKLRAAETAEILAGAVAPEAEPLVRSGLDPLSPCDGLVAELNAAEEDTMLVGHLPFMGNLLFRMVRDPQKAEGIMFTTGTVVCLEKGEDSWNVVWTDTPQPAK